MNSTFIKRQWLNGRDFKVCQFFLVQTVLLLVLVLSQADLHAQADTHWDNPVVLFNAGETARVYTPLVIEDTEGEIKILWETTSITEAEDADRPSGVYCIQGDGISWSPPVDVISVPDNGRAFWLRHALDRFGRLHLIYVGPNAQLFHSLAPSAEACDARSWKTMIVSTPDQVLYGNMDVDDQGIIHIIYSALGQEVYYMRSLDDGFSWTEPTAISIGSPDRATAFPDLAVDKTGQIHVVWEEDQLPNGVPSLGLFYASSQDEGQSWSSPILFSEDNDGYTQPTIVTLDDGTVHLLWNGRIGVRGRYHQWSSDRSATWSLTREFIPKAMGGGQTGPPAYAIDSIGGLHVVSGTDDTTYSVWDGQEWSTPQDIAPFNAFGNMEDQNITVFNGKELYVVTNADLQQIVLIRGTNDLPKATRMFEPLPTNAMPTVSSTILPTSPPPEAVILPSSYLAAPKPADNSFLPIGIGGGLAFMVILVVVLFKNSRHRS